MLPRHGDVVKWAILPLGFLVGATSRGLPSTQSTVRAVLVWASLELLIYQARYQWNDIRGFEADQRHPAGDRGRLPGPMRLRRSHVTWSAVTAALKVGVAVVVWLPFDRTTAGLVAVLAIAVFVLAGVYERLRATSTGLTGEVPTPVTPGVGAIWFVIGAGYALRAVTGLGLAVDIVDPGLLVVSSVVACWAMGIAWVTSRWAVEATAFARLGSGRLHWSAEPQDAREHQLALVRWLPSRVPDHVDDLATWRAARGVPTWWAPWSVAGVLAAGSAAVTGVLLADPQAPARVLWLSLGVGSAAAAGLLASGPWRELLTAAMAPAVVGALAVAGVNAPLRASTAWFVFAVSQACYLRQDRATLGTFLRRMPRFRPGRSRDSPPEADHRPGTETWISTS